MLYYLLKFILFLVQIIPIKLRRIIGKTIGNIVPLIAKKEKQIADLQIRKILKINHSNHLANAVFSNLAVNLFETINLKPILKQHKELIEIKDENLIQELLRHQGSIIALTAHTGNWDLLAAYAVQRGMKVVTMGKAVRNNSIQRLLEDLRNQYKIKTIWRNSIKSNRELIDLVKSKVLLAALIDQDTTVKSQPSKFFDLNCKTPISLIELGLKQNSKFICAFMFKKENDRYVLHLKEIKERDIDSILSVYNNYLESLIKLYPEQWVWFHKRWRTTKDGKTMSHQEYLEFLSNLNE